MHQPFGRMFMTPLLPYRNGDTAEIDEEGYRRFLRVFLTDENLDAGLRGDREPGGRRDLLPRAARRRSASSRSRSRRSPVARRCSRARST